MIAYVATLNGDTITITIPVSLIGSSPSTNLANEWQHGIAKAWNNQKWKYGNCRVVFDPIVRVGGAYGNTIYADPQPDSYARSWVDPGGSSGRWYTNLGGWGAAHEAGHLMGLPDEYFDIPGTFPQQYQSYPGWEENIMGSYNGEVEQRNINSVVERWLSQEAMQECECHH